MQGSKNFIISEVMKLTQPTQSNDSTFIPDAETGSLFPLLQKTMAHAAFPLSFTNDRFTDLQSWKQQARAKVKELLHYHPEPCAPQAEVIERVDCGDFVREKILFNTTSDIRVPAYLLLPKGEEKPSPAIVALHDHGGYFVYGKEKLVRLENEHPTMTQFKDNYYGGRSVADELARRGYVVIVIDMFYWGERRMLMPEDSRLWHTRDVMSEQDIRAFNMRSSQLTWQTGVGLSIAGITWAGLMFWDDIRTIDYLVSRPEVDPDRIGCCGLSVGAYRAVHLAGLDERIKAAVVVGWMCSFPAMLQNKLSSIGPMKIIPGLYQLMDLPDIAAMTCPGALMCIHGTRDGLFTNEGVHQAFKKLTNIYSKAGVPEKFAGVTYDGPHEFNAPMQDKAFAWLEQWLKL